VWLVCYVKTAIDSFRIVAKKNADGVLLNRDLPPEFRKIRLGRVKKLFSLPGIGQRASAVLLKRLCKLQRILSGLNRVLRYL
jgi:hypothetical protein